MRRKHATRTAIVGLASGMLLGGAAATAPAADDGAGGAPDGTIVATSYRLVASDYIGDLDLPEGGDGQVGGLLKVTTSDGRTLFAYCLDAATPTEDGAAYREAGRSDVPTLKDNRDAGKIDWVLRHAYPVVSEDALGELIGAKLSKGAAAGATQAALWRFSHQGKAVPWNPAAADLADYLVAHAEDAEEPVRPLSLAPGSVTGAAGSLLGPIGISTSGDRVAVTLDPAAAAAGVTLTDPEGTVLSGADGKPTRPAKDGDALYVNVPSDARQGGATVSATSLVPTRVGQKLVSADSQPLALVSGDRIPVTADARADWTAAASPSPTADPSGSASAAPGHSTSPTAPGGATTTPGTPGTSASASAGPHPGGTTTTPATPGTSASASAGPHPGGTTGPDTTGGATPPPTAGDPELASTGTGGVLGFLAAAAGGLATIGGAVVLLHEYRRRFRTED
ncbi:thioester domain-containing protein [Streptomyces sp. NRRL F-5727]|uniref:thioester domain-containing protein n=1 Tax=Streptomyces sp. NRRL F-5727 TaxID=1463871 RepID=UPI00131CAAEB|nr:thioester domain-containing protein [Streptomyces sp. NRRL F-5727]